MAQRQVVGMSGMLAVVEILLAALGVVFALLAWLASRERHPFRLSERRGDLVQLTRSRRPTVLIRSVHVPHMWPLITQDAAATAEWRVLPRDGALILDVRRIASGEPIVVTYRRVWSWDGAAAHWHRAGAFKGKLRGLIAKAVLRGADLHTKDGTQRYREKLDADEGKWKRWYGHLL
ncbi:hypothetical protein [Mycolicibacterium setense]